MQIEIFSDVVCPWCAIGKRRFEAALEHFSHANEVEVRWRAFELDPSAPLVSNVNTASHLAEKYNMTREQAVAAQEKLATTAALEGLEFHFENTKRGNTFDAHRLLHYAYEVGLQDALKERLFVAYFTEGKEISDRATLVRLGEEVGLDAIKSAEVLDGNRYAAEVRSDESEAQELGISGVPFFVIDRRFGISGAQSPDNILHVLNEAWTKKHPPVIATQDSGSACEDGSCTV